MAANVLHTTIGMWRSPLARSRRLHKKLAVCAAMIGMLGGCAVVSVASSAASLVVGTVGLAADVTIGAARVTGKAIGAAAGAVTPSTDE